VAGVPFLDWCLSNFVMFLSPIFNAKAELLLVSVKKNSRWRTHLYYLYYWFAVGEATLSLHYLNSNFTPHTHPFASFIHNKKETPITDINHGISQGNTNHGH
jgi:hypothetical protein